jgi:LacI family transcriptional regulator
MRKVTISDVAKAAGVAKSTVSRTINNRGSVKPQTRQKILEKIEELGFSPNVSARSLKTNRRKQIALAIDDIRNPFYPEFAWAAEQVAKLNDYRLVLINHYGKASEELAVIEEASRMHVDGIILVSVAFPRTLKRLIKKTATPITLIGDFGEDMPADMVFNVNNAGTLAVEHLIRIGRTRIAYAGGPKGSHQGVRFVSYKTALISNLMPFDEQLVFMGDDFSLQTGLEAARYFAGLDSPPDAVFAGNDMIAIGLVRGLMERGFKIPEDIAVVGMDDIKWSVITTPQISSVSLLSAEQARIAVEILLERIEKGNALPYRRVSVEPRLIVRESSVRTLHRP